MTAEKSDLWSMAQHHLQATLDKHSFKNWFSQTRFESFEDGLLVIQVPSLFFANWLRDHYLETISESVGKIDPEFKEIRFVPSSDLNEAVVTSELRVADDVTAGKSRRRRLRKKDQTHKGFNRRYTFDRFVIGSGNRFAHAAARAVAESPGTAYNPLFLYGATGVGKTHLMQSIGSELIERDPSANIVFISSEQFTNQLIESIAKKSTQRFRAKYRKVDVLLIDDIHFIAGKEATQEEFFHTFNELFDMHKQIVLCSDRGPKEIQRLEERLVSRFEWGLVTDIQAPDVETRVAILQNKAAEENLTVSPDTIRYIASCVSTNVRELEGAFVTVLAYSKLTQQEITIALIDQVLSDLIGNATFKPITMERIQKTVAEYFDLRISDMRGRSRQRQVAYPRQLAMYLCKQLIPTLTLSEVGEAFGGKDHTTVLYASQKISAEKEKDEDTRQLLSEFEKTIRA